MESHQPCVLVLSGKSSVEKELAVSLKNSNTLKLPDHPDVSLFLHSEAQKPLLADAAAFKIDSYMNSLSTTRFGRFLVWSPRLPSTHDVVSQSFEECVGISGRLPVVFFYDTDGGWASCATCAGIPRLDVRIKWPNDLYLNGLKVGGILCTSTYRSKKFNVCSGIGLNVDNTKPSTCLNAVLQKLTSVAHQLQREDIIAAFFNKFEKLFDLFISQGFQPLEELYYNTWLHNGQRVIVQHKDEDQDEVVENVVTIQGLTSSGFLQALGDDGQMYELHPDGNSFDFFKGLVRRKLA
ncbi:hypothetical protein RJ640_023441 [Escallonia rubra]|uniref:BPL/LPL catalytic domain-containing protein n=1 Tax=Escallonia rubra TaxID=112253 RepID=A0AA88U4P0_9ASTE|nr:hypothetical protein RJ640_023441 [Escallonia rubra]